MASHPDLQGLDLTQDGKLTLRDVETIARVIPDANFGWWTQESVYRPATLWRQGRHVLGPPKASALGRYRGPIMNWRLNRDKTDYVQEADKNEVLFFWEGMGETRRFHVDRRENNVFFVNSLTHDESLTLNKMSDLLKTNPGTTYYSWEVPPDTRTIAQKLYKSKPREKDWVFVGELVSIDVGPEGPQREPGHSVTYTFNNNGTRIDRNSHIYTGDEVTSFKVAKLGHPRPTAPPVDGGRKRSSRVKKQTRRAQRKRRNTKRR